MRKLFIGLGVVVAVLVAAVLIVPSFIDWNTYKGEIEAQVEKLTGRKLVIAGDISIAVLPAPAVIAHDVSFANDERSEVPSMLELGSLEVRVALGPLFSGEVQVNKVVLVEPVIQLETFADGSDNWTLNLATDDAGGGEGGGDTAGSGGETSGFGGFKLDNFAVERGLLTFRDGSSGTLHVVEDINATLVAASLQGPFETRGSLVAMGVPLGFEAGIDGIFQGRTVPITAVVTTGGDSSFGLTGNIINLFKSPRFNGQVQIKTSSLAGLMSSVGGSAPPALAMPFSLNGTVVGDQAAVTIDELKIVLGDTLATGQGEATLGEMPRADITLEVAHVDADSLLAGLGTKPAAATGQGQDQAQETGAGAVTQAQDAPVASEPVSIEIPNGVAASLDVIVESIAYRQEKAGPVRLSAELANGEVTLSQFTGQLPGATDFAVFGFLTAPDGNPSFEGEVEASVGDTRRLATWLGADISSIPGDRLRRIDLSASLRGNAENLQVAGLSAAFDRTNVKGGLTLALRERLSFGAAIEVDSLDLDPYLAGLAGGTSSKATASEQTSQLQTSSESSTPAAATANPLAALGALSTFDANIKAQAGEIIYQGQAIRGIVIDGTVFNGGLTIRDASVADAAGSRVALKGTIKELAGIPKLDGFSVDFASKNIGRLAAMADVALPDTVEDIGAITLTTTANGNLLQPTLKGSVAAAGTAVSFDGEVSVLPIKPLYAGTLRVRHADLAALAKTLKTGYVPSGKIGGVDLSTNASVTAETVTLQGMSGKLNETTFSGDTTVHLGGARPNIRTTLALGVFDADPFLPAGSGGQTSSGGTTASAQAQSAGYAHGKAPWPRDPIDMSGLGAVDAAVNVTAKKLAYGAIALNDATIVARLADSQLTIEQLTGTAFGGGLDVAGFIDGRSTPVANGSVSFKNASISNLLTAVIGEPAAVGSVALDTTFDTRGASVADMVGALNGNGAFAMRGVDVKGATQGSAMTGILGLLRSFGQLGSSLSGKKLEGFADVDGRFAVQNGVADLSPLTIASGLGDGNASGKVDLAGWTVDLVGNVDLTGNILSALIGQKIGTPGKLPFSVKGTLDAPDIAMDTSGLASGGLSIPGLGKLEEKVPGVGTLLQGILGGGTSTQSQSEPSGQTDGGTGSQPEPQPQSQEQNPVLQPEELLKNIFKF